MRIPQLDAGRTARAVFVLDVERRWTRAPAQPGTFVFPRQVPRDVRGYLQPSPQVESEHPEIRKAARQFAIDADKPIWPQVEAIYSWVRERVGIKKKPFPCEVRWRRYGRRKGDCQEYTSLFVAMCRANGIPARSVWVPGHAYPEFYLQDRYGNGYWFPCESLGPYSFGKLHRHEVVLQKGDIFKVSQKKQRQRYIEPTLSGFPAGRGGGSP